MNTKDRIAFFLEMENVPKASVSVDREEICIEWIDKAGGKRFGIWIDATDSGYYWVKENMVSASGALSEGIPQMLVDFWKDGQ